MEGKLGPKAISKKIKAKGLQKLKLYCELCEKQCRDENGFKCHATSEGHQRQMQLFGENPDKFIQDFSQKFEDAFLAHLKRSHGFSRVAATVVYNEYISDRHHLHMNATKWVSLTKFVEYLGHTGKCKVDYTDKGLFITGLFEQSKKKRLREDDKQEKEIAKQIERASSAAVAVAAAAPIEMEKRDDDLESPTKNKKVAFAFSFSSSRKKS